MPEADDHGRARTTTDEHGGDIMTRGELQQELYELMDASNDVAYFNGVWPARAAEHKDRLDRSMLAILGEFDRLRAIAFGPRENGEESVIRHADVRPGVYVARARHTRYRKVDVVRVIEDGGRLLTLKLGAAGAFMLNRWDYLRRIEVPEMEQEVEV